MKVGHDRQFLRLGLCVSAHGRLTRVEAAFSLTVSEESHLGLGLSRRSFTVPRVVRSAGLLCCRNIRKQQKRGNEATYRSND